MGKEVENLKREVIFLRKSLFDSNPQQDILRNRLAYFERREEEELIRGSIELENDRVSKNRYQKYVKFAPSNFSKGFVTSKQSRR